MHIVLGILGSIVSILYMLDRLGIDLGGLNPFYWRRRRAWARQYHGDPIYSVENPMDVAAADGDPSPKQVEYIEEIRGQFTPPDEKQGIWS